MSVLLLAAGAAAAATTSLKETYDEPVARLVGEALISQDAYHNLGYLCDRIGHRLSGSPELDRAIAWATAQMKAEGLANVHTEPVMVPAWVRGEEHAWLEEPEHHDLHILGLGMSVGTPAGGITADVVVVSNFTQLDSLGETGVRGKIVLYDEPWVDYGQTGRYRITGASHAARFGAVAALVRSVTGVSLDTPHTGTLYYSDDAPHIPAAAVTVENAAMMHRMADRGERIRLHLEMGAHMDPDAPSANVIGEVPGSGKSDEVVVVGGHIDSWDVGQGAQDDGTGCVIAMEAAHLIQKLGLKPRRTIRVVLFTNEENGSRGGDGYRDQHKAELDRHVAMIESDIGNGRASGFDLDIRPVGTAGGDSARTMARTLAVRQSAMKVLNDLGLLLVPIDAGVMSTGHSGADVGPSVATGVTGLGVNHDASHYFDIHHTNADTFDKIIPGDLAHNVAVVAVMAYVLADMPGRLDQAP